ncbi:MAG: HD-GYP domain-containing protein [Spirochaetaceae bacterium]|jgi:HD-GYP domain-containing protein (c-di-GMP phosphodiesterase class II)|nr:HD-GYP domain-containing protein [Spirochaetaceae bacterium]
MKPVPVSALSEGARYSEPLYVDGAVFLAANTEITKKDMELLNSLAVTEVFTDGTAYHIDTALLGGEGNKSDKKPPEDPPPPQTNTNTAAQIKTPLTVAASDGGSVFRRLSEEIKLLSSVFNTIGMKVGIKPRIIWTIVATLLQLIKRDKNNCIEFILCNNIRSMNLAKSSINTALLTALIAMEKGISDRLVPELVSAAILHDTGMLRLPRVLLEKQTPLTDEEKIMIQSHTVHSYHIVLDELRYSETTALAVLQHHERWDGMGYPQRLAGNDIDKGARIIAVADSFEALVSSKPYRNSMTANNAIKMMMSENHSHFSPGIIDVFVKVMGIYPVGSGVVLNNGINAKVLDTNKDAPLRPIVKVLTNASGDTVNEEEIINLLDTRNLYITKTFALKSYG